MIKQLNEIQRMQQLAGIKLNELEILNPAPIFTLILDEGDGSIDLYYKNKKIKIVQIDDDVDFYDAKNSKFLRVYSSQPDGQEVDEMEFAKWEEKIRELNIIMDNESIKHKGYAEGKEYFIPINKLKNFDSIWGYLFNENYKKTGKELFIKHYVPPAPQVKDKEIDSMKMNNKGIISFKGYMLKTKLKEIKNGYHGTVSYFYILDNKNNKVMHIGLNIPITIFVIGSYEVFPYDEFDYTRKLYVKNVFTQVYNVE